ncbi:Phenylalanine--tRNA ligase beta subunit [Halotydeus destructor]|nr:Phenylalanine--tRNA ligase beta subunit [Halotydeus destructor]
MFSEYCAEKFTVEPIEVISSGSVQRYPDLKYRRETISVEKVNKLLGTNIKPGDMCKLLTRMSLKSELVSGNHPQIDVVIPPTRQDILHACDIAEDVGVAFGFNNIENTLPNAVTIGKQLTMSKITDQLRFEISRCGYTEALTFSLCSREDIADNLRKPEKISEAVLISNPKTFEFQVARTTLIPGLLKTIQANKRMPLPLKLFEISDIVLKDPAKDVGAKNERRLCILKYNKTPGFEAIHGLLDRVMQVMEIPYVGDKGDKLQGYFIQSCEDNTFLKGRCAKIVSRGKDVGVMGVLHPDVLTKFELNMPCALLELDIELLSHNSVS